MSRWPAFCQQLHITCPISLICCEGWTRDSRSRTRCMYRAHIHAGGRVPNTSQGPGLTAAVKGRDHSYASPVPAPLSFLCVWIICRQLRSAAAGRALRCNREWLQTRGGASVNSESKFTPAPGPHTGTTFVAHHRHRAQGVIPVPRMSRRDSVISLPEVRCQHPTSTTPSWRKVHNCYMHVQGAQLYMTHVAHCSDLHQLLHTPSHMHIRYRACAV